MDSANALLVLDHEDAVGLAVIAGVACLVRGIRELAELPRQEELDLLGDVDRVVAHALERASRQVHVHAPIEAAWIVGELQRLQMHVAVQPIDRIVQLRELHAQRRDRAARTRPSRCGSSTPRGCPSRRAAAPSARSRGRCRVIEVDLRDVHGLVADPLEVQAAVQDRRDQAEVGRHRGLQRQELQNTVVDLQVELVDLVVAVDDALCRLASSRSTTASTAFGTDGRREIAHDEELALDVPASSSWNCVRVIRTAPSRSPRSAGPRGVVKIVSVRSNSTSVPVRCPSSETSTVKNAVRSETRRGLLHVVGHDDDRVLRQPAPASGLRCGRVAIGSSAEHGSSIKITSGFVAIARAMHRRCCCPPDNAMPECFQLVLDLVPECRARAGPPRRARPCRPCSRRSSGRTRRCRRSTSGTGSASGRPCRCGGGPPPGPRLPP